eukprot:CAMPEP_0113561342 /NCGR_PEP_ID=MMETSP0015_2-20120614/19924_1 /TAXON_ID=2838 /ORGANISM="Odontella" /LENGTH=135 /DNA_ID=CAMNT_0000463129 /DNA_START=63 /DNA_END=467 /DNA_ORIENTATION=- /assembly_acc=CAM_ASM_000160
MAGPPSRSNSSSSSSAVAGRGRTARPSDPPKEAQRKSGGGGSKVFVLFASITLVFGAGNIAYHHLAHDEADIARVAEDLFRSTHFRTVKDPAAKSGPADHDGRPVDPKPSNERRAAAPSSSSNAGGVADAARPPP